MSPPSSDDPPGRHRGRRLANRQRPPDQGSPAGHRRRRGAQPGNLNAWRHGLYARTLTPDALRALAIARKLKATDLTEEIAALRGRLAALEPVDVAAFTKGIAILIRAAQAQHRMSPQATKDLAQALAATLNALGDQLLPPAD